MATNELALRYLMLLEMNSSAEGGIRRGERFEKQLKNFFNLHAKNFTVELARFFDSDKFKLSYKKSANTIYLRKIIEAAVKDGHSITGGLNIPDFYIVDGEYLLPNPNSVVSENENNAQSKAKLLNTLLISLLVYINSNAKKKVVTPKILLYIVVREETFNKGPIKLLAAHPQEYFREFLKFKQEDESWKVAFNQVIDAYSDEKIHHQFEIQINVIPGQSASIDISGLEKSLEKLYEEKKKWFQPEQPVVSETTQSVAKQLPCDIKNNYSNSHYCQNGIDASYGQNMVQVRDMQVFYFEGGALSIGQKDAIFTNLKTTFEFIWAKDEEAAELSAIIFEIGDVETDETTANLLMLLINDFEEAFREEYQNRYQKNISNALTLSVPQAKYMMLLKSQKLLDKYIESH